METLALEQKHPLKGSRMFTLDNEEVHYIIKSPVQDEELSVALHVLDAVPVIEDSTLSFVSQVNREPLVEFFTDNPDKDTFDEFINILKQRIAEEDFSRFRVTDDGVNVEVARLEESINMLMQYVDPAEIDSLLAALVALKDKPTDLECQRQVADTFNELGFVQGQVITYAPYLTYLLTGNKDQGNFPG